jgi:hypothetical protein
LVAFHAFARTQFDLPILSIQCDNGGEFVNTRIDTLCSTYGVLLRFLCPHTSQQNGKAEHALCITNDVIRTLLIQVSLPAFYWVEALYFHLPHKHTTHGGGTILHPLHHLVRGLFSLS